MKRLFVFLPPLLILFIPSLISAFTPEANLADFSERFCTSAEECFRAAIAPVQAALTLSPDDRLRLKAKQLQVVRERHPGSLWAKQAGLLIGLTLIERDPAEAIQFLKVAQRDFPILDDYIRFWIGESLLRTGDWASAASVFESIEEVVPETALASRAAYRAGEAWFREGACDRALDLLAKAVMTAPQEPAAPSALMKLAECQARERLLTAASKTLRQIWVRYPHAPEAREAARQLVQGMGENGERWQPMPEELLERANIFFVLAFHEEAVEEFRKFLLAAPNHPKREEAKLKLGTALVRLKRYDQAREVFQGLLSAQAPAAGEAAVWLARIHLRQGEVERLEGLRQSFSKIALSSEQKATILLLAGMGYEDQGRYEEALARYQQAAQVGSSQRVDALWRIGWLQYQTGHYGAALESFGQILASREDPSWTPQALYWAARVREHLADSRASEQYVELCRRYPFSYYCQLVQTAGRLPDSVSISTAPAMPVIPEGAPGGKIDLRRNLRYRKAAELKVLGLEQEAARELAEFVQELPRDRADLLELAVLLNEAGAVHQALRLARLHFRDSLQGSGESLPRALWTVAYPTIYVPVIQAYAGASVDPFLVAAIIREESQYDARALSRVGAVGLMQLMPTTAQAMARRSGPSPVTREDLFDQDTNIRFGVQYLAQLLQQFSGNLIHAIAAYNAGPSAVSGWITKYKDRDPDEFVELIPYQETRQYVKRVLQSYREYQRLAAGGVSGLGDGAR